MRIWGDAGFRRLSPIPPCGQGLWFYLLTNANTTNIPGLYRGGEAQFADELGWPPKAFREAFAEVFQEGMAEADWKARVVWVKGACKYNRPESPNVVRGWATAWDEIPECDLKATAFRHLKAFVEGLGEAFGKAFDKACRQPLPNQEQEQEQEQEEETDPLARDARSGDPVIEVFAHYRTYHPRAFPRPAMASKEAQLIRARLKEGSTVEDLKLAIDGYHRSPYHCGQNDSGTKYQGLELIVRNGSKVAKGIDFASQYQAAPGAMTATEKARADMLAKQAADPLYNPADDPESPYFIPREGAEP